VEQPWPSTNPSAITVFTNRILSNKLAALSSISQYYIHSSISSISSCFMARFHDNTATGHHHSLFLDFCDRWFTAGTVTLTPGPGDSCVLGAGYKYSYLLTYLLNSLAGWSVSCCHQSSSVKTNPEHKANWTLDELTSYLRYWMSNVNRSTASWPRACLSTTLPRQFEFNITTLLNFSLINVLQQGAFTWSWVSSIIHYLSRCCTIALDRHYHQLAGCCLSVCLSVCQYRYSRIFAVRYYA